MAICPMERVYLFFRAEALDALVAELREAGVLEVTTVPEDERRPFLAGRSGEPPGREEIPGLEGRTRRLERIVEYLRPLEKAPPPRVTEKEVERLAGEIDLEAVAGRVDALAKRESSINLLSSALEKTASRLREIGFVDISGAELKSPVKAATGIYRLPSGLLPRLAWEIDKIDGFCVPLSAGRRETFVFAAWPSGAGRRVRDLLAENRAAPIEFPAWRTPVAETARRVERLLERNRQRRERVEKEKARLRRLLPSLFALLDLVLAEKALAEARGRAVLSGRTGIMTGWARKSDRGRIAAQVTAKFPETIHCTRVPRPGEDVPVSLDNGPASRPFEAVGDLYGRTAYGGVDASPYLMVFFALGFGFCLADVGYGLAITLLATGLARRFRSEAARKMLRVFVFSGLATILAGVLTNSFFGNFLDAFPFVPPFLSTLQSRLAIASPADNPVDTMRFFYFALFFGYFQTTFGVFLRFRRALGRNGLGGALETAPAVVFQLGIPLLVAAFFFRGSYPPAAHAVRPLAALITAAAILIVRQQFRLYRDIIERLFWSAYSIYGMVVGNLISDILSYSRIFALGLTSALLAVTVNELARMAGSAPLVGFLAAALVLAVGHSFNLFISGLGSYVHTSRLQYLEFFTKFYEGGGRVFDPLRRRYRYLEVISGAPTGG